jgi:hypothetical protein
LISEYYDSNDRENNNCCSDDVKLGDRGSDEKVGENEIEDEGRRGEGSYVLSGKER